MAAQASFTAALDRSDLTVEADCPGAAWFHGYLPDRLTPASTMSFFQRRLVQTDIEFILVFPC